MVEIEILDPNLDKKPCPSAIQVESSQSIAATWQHIASSWDALDAREYWSCEFTELVVASSFSDPFKGLQYSVGRECCITTNHFCQSYWYWLVRYAFLTTPGFSCSKTEEKQARELFNQEWEAFEEECRGPGSPAFCTVVPQNHWKLKMHNNSKIKQFEVSYYHVPKHLPTLTLCRPLWSQRVVVIMDDPQRWVLFPKTRETPSSKVPIKLEGKWYLTVAVGRPVKDVLQKPPSPRSSWQRRYRIEGGWYECWTAPWSQR